MIIKCDNCGQELLVSDENAVITSAVFVCKRCGKKMEIMENIQENTEELLLG